MKFSWRKCVYFLNIFTFGDRNQQIQDKSVVFFLQNHLASIFLRHMADTSDAEAMTGFVLLVCQRQTVLKPDFLVTVVIRVEMKDIRSPIS